MAFKPISLNDYLKKHLKNNPSQNEDELRESLTMAISSFENGIKCTCGNEIWVIGSASIGNSCFSCITGEGYPKDVYEIDTVLEKKENQNPSTNINENGDLINGFYDDDGNQINLNIIPKPTLCISCINNDNPKEEFFCNMTRFDQKEDKEFKCSAYVNIKK